MKLQINYYKDLSGNFEPVDFQFEKLLVPQEKINRHEMANAIIVQRANQRAANAHTLTKAQVRGGGKKPYKQKHTGKARQGSIRSPQYVGGGRAFGPTNEKNYHLKQNRKAYRLAFRSAFTLKLLANNLGLLIDELKISKPSTNLIANMINTANLKGQKVLFVLDKAHETFAKSCHNLKKVTVKLWNQLSVVDFLHYDCTIIQNNALTKLNEVFKNE